METETGFLSNILKSNPYLAPDKFRKRYIASLSAPDFNEYYLSVLAQNGIKRGTAAERSGLEIHYAYQIMSGVRKPGRDKIICLCIGGGFSLKETNRALLRAGLGSLYPKKFRDAIIILAINRGIHTVLEVNELLSENGEELLG